MVLQGPSIFTGNAHPDLASRICAYLEQPLGHAEVFSFSNENIFVQLGDNVRERDVFVVQPAARPVNNNFMELLIMLDAVRRASARGFDNPVMLDHEGHVAEFATANLFIVRDGQVHTPAENGTFLAGITRRRVMSLLRDAGWEVFERSMTWEEVRTADEVFSTGNYNKVMPATRIDNRDLQPGPAYREARELYFAYARDNGHRL